MNTNDYTLLFAEVFSGDRYERISQVRALAAEFIKKRVSGVIYDPPVPRQDGRRGIQAAFGTD